MQLTMFRIVCIPPILWALYAGTELSLFLAALGFIIASITDAYDGHFARKFGAVSTMGKFMDPIADKVLVTSILTMLILPGKLDPFLVILLSARDTVIGGIRAIAAADGLIIDAKAAGKWKTGLQMAAIPAVIVGHFPFLPEFCTWFYPVGYGLLWFSTVLSMISGFDYYRAYVDARKATARG